MKEYTIVGLCGGQPCTDYVDAETPKEAILKFLSDRDETTEVVDVFEGTLSSVMPSEYFETVRLSDIRGE